MYISFNVKSKLYNCVLFPLQFRDFFYIFDGFLNFQIKKNPK